jgi:hypothetical protein
MSKTTTQLVLGTTRTGKAIILPDRRAPDTNDALKFRKLKASFATWTRGDHIDANALLGEYAANHNHDARGRQLAGNWAAAHWDIGGRWTSEEDTTFAGVRL